MARHDLEIGLSPKPPTPKSSYNTRLETLFEDTRANGAAYMAGLLIENDPESRGVFEYINEIHTDRISRTQRKEIYPKALEWADQLAEAKQFYACEQVLTIAYECATNSKQRDEAFALHLEIAREAAQEDLEEYASDAIAILKNAARLANKSQPINAKRIKHMTSACLGLAKESLQNKESSISSDILILAMDGFGKAQPIKIREGIKNALWEPNEEKRIQELGELENLNQPKGALLRVIGKVIGRKGAQQETQLS